MLTSPRYPGRVLYGLDDLSPLAPLAPLAEIGIAPDDLEALKRIARWAEDYLTQPHPELGRSGPVCPYAQTAMRRRAFRMAIFRGQRPEVARVEAALLDYRNWFLEIPPQEGLEAAFKTTLVLFPDLAPEAIPEVIDRTQERLKGEYVPQGLMIGEFHDRPPAKAGLWNPAFRPLRSPVPMLVIRHMVATDFAFLKDDRNFLLAYLSRFRREIPQHLREEVIQAALSHGIRMPSAGEMEGVHPRVAAALTAHDVPFVVHLHRDLPVAPNGPHDVARQLGYPIERITKSLFLRCRCHGRYAVVVCPVNRRVDLRSLAAHLGCSRLEMASVQEAAALLGYAPGGISPIGIDANIPVLMDAGLLRHATVLSAAGEVAVELELSPADLKRLTGATVLPVATEAAEAGVEPGGGAL